MGTQAQVNAGTLKYTEPLLCSVEELKIKEVERQ